MSLGDIEKIRGRNLRLLLRLYLRLRPTLRQLRQKGRGRGDTARLAEAIRRVEDMSLRSSYYYAGVLRVLDEIDTSIDRSPTYFCPACGAPLSPLRYEDVKKEFRRKLERVFLAHPEPGMGDILEKFFLHFFPEEGLRGRVVFVQGRGAESERAAAPPEKREPDEVIRLVRNKGTRREWIEFKALYGSGPVEISQEEFERWQRLGVPGRGVEYPC
jgi:hypothetical protein